MSDLHNHPTYGFTVWSREPGEGWVQEAIHREDRCRELAELVHKWSPRATVVVMPPGETPFQNVRS